MRPNLVKEKLAAGEPTVGMWLTLGSPLVAEHIAHAGFDWLVVDMEHGPADLPIAMNCFQAISTTDTVPLARVASNDAAQIKRILDVGAMGIVVPMVNSAQDAKRAVEAMKFPPGGIRSMAMGRGGVAYGDDYLDAANDEILVIVQVEHPEGVADVEAIANTPGVDVCFIGPYDLAATMGVQRGSEEHEAAIQTVVAAADRAGVPAGMYCDDADMVIERMAQGLRFLANADDTRCLQTMARDECAAIARAARRG
jgi:4-hydroxy-2-oxoheptanedioate aldolase